MPQRSDFVCLRRLLREIDHLLCVCACETSCLSTQAICTRFGRLPCCVLKVRHAPRPQGAESCVEACRRVKRLLGLFLGGCMFSVFFLFFVFSGGSLRRQRRKEGRNAGRKKGRKEGAKKEARKEERKIRRNEMRTPQGRKEGLVDFILPPHVLLLSLAILLRVRPGSSPRRIKGPPGLT